MCLDCQHLFKKKDFTFISNLKSNLKLGSAQIASSDGGSEGRDSDIWTEYGGEVGFIVLFVFVFVFVIVYVFVFYLYLYLDQVWEGQRFILCNCNWTDCGGR